MSNKLSEIEEIQEVENNTENQSQELDDTNFKDKVISYLKYDDLIRKMTEDMKELKNKRKDCEELIIDYLNKKDSPFVNVKSGKLIVNKTETKSSLKLDIIKDSILERIKEENIVGDNDDDNEKYIKITADILTLMEEKREKKTRINLKRSFNRKKKIN